MKLLKMVQKSGGGRIRKSNRGVEYDQSTLMHIWKYYNETPLYN
jgi:hypothetical protein